MSCARRLSSSTATFWSNQTASTFRPATRTFTAGGVRECRSQSRTNFSSSLALRPGELGAVALERRAQCGAPRTAAAEYGVHLVERHEAQVLGLGERAPQLLKSRTTLAMSSSVSAGGVTGRRLCSDALAVCAAVHPHTGQRQAATRGDHMHPPRHRLHESQPPAARHVTERSAGAGIEQRGRQPSLYSKCKMAQRIDARVNLMQTLIRRPPGNDGPPDATSHQLGMGNDSPLARRQLGQPNFAFASDRWYGIAEVRAWADHGPDGVTR